MREIKFRAWDKINNLWIDELYLMRLHPLKGIVVEIQTLDGETYGPHQFTLMQYTGLKDKNGVEIYEGDIVKDQIGAGEVKWLQEHCAFVVRSLAPHSYHFLTSDGKLINTEVIGNIHKHPYLLDEQHG